MDNRFIKASTLKSIADAIRAKKGTSSPVAVTNFAEEIKSIVGGGGDPWDGDYTIEGEPIPDTPVVEPNLIEQTFTENGEYSASDEGADGYSKVTVNVPMPEGDTLTEFLKVRNGQYLCYGATNMTEVPEMDTRNVTDMQYMFGNCSELTTVPEMDTRNVTNMSHMFYRCSNLTSVPLFDTSNVTNMKSMFYQCSKLTTVPEMDTRNVTNMSNMFGNCSELTTVPEMDTRNVTDMSDMFNTCSNLTSVPLFDTSNVTNMKSMFYNCDALISVPSFDIRNVTSISNMFYVSNNFTDVRLRNIKANLQVSDGTSWGHLLTVDSLVHLIYELRDTGSTKTLTVGTANLEKLANVYVKAIEITDEMRAEDDLVDEKHPFVVCESTDEGAMLITDYATTVKNWTIK